MKAKTIGRKILSMLLVCIMMLSLMPATAFAAGSCRDCGEELDGVYCHDCYICYDCADNLCAACEYCADCSGYEICEGCTMAEGFTICLNCINEDYHCPGDETHCYFTTGLWCDNCGVCEQCEYICEDCAFMGMGSFCLDCAITEGLHCGDCGDCFVSGDICQYCEGCKECGGGYCQECCDDGIVACIDCLRDKGEIHCWNCDGHIGVSGDVDFCMECGVCAECTELCEGCSEEQGDNYCEECAIDKGWHCPGCDGCYAETGDPCPECELCNDCAPYCENHNMCAECAEAEGYHCPNCYACGEDAIICSDCGSMCSECADGFCEDTELCSDCVDFCPNCGECADCFEFCPNCEEFCASCDTLCDDCGHCETCCRDEADAWGCDCSYWVCVESSEWESHLRDVHNGSSSGEHKARAAKHWTSDRTNHWHTCIYCDVDNPAHYTSKAPHSYGTDDICDVCGYNKGVKIQITEQPQDVKNVKVSNVDGTDYIARFRVSAKGETALTYQWYQRTKNKSTGVYIDEKLVSPKANENFTGRVLSVIVPTEACCDEYLYFCRITDRNGNSVDSNVAVLKAKHDYQYFQEGTNIPLYHVSADGHNHVLQCLGECCRSEDKVTRPRPHVDLNGDDYCDICKNKIVGKLTALNIEFASIASGFKVGMSHADAKAALARSFGVTSYPGIANFEITDFKLREFDGVLYPEVGAGNVIDDAYVAELTITGEMLNGTPLPTVIEGEDSDFITVNGRKGYEKNVRRWKFDKDSATADIKLWLMIYPAKGALYSISVLNGTAYDVNTPITAARFGDHVTVKVDESKNPKPGEYEFLYWRSNVVGYLPYPVDAKTASFTMPNRYVVLSAVFGPAHTHADDNNDGACDVCDFHTPTHRSNWSYNNTYHWKTCRYCDDARHYSTKVAHSYSTKGVCTVCGYNKNSTLKITQQPEDVRNVYVSNADDDHDENIATFRVTATGGTGTLTYQWYRIPRSGGKPTALEGETNAVLALVIGTDACYNPYDYYCVVTDGARNSVTSNAASLFAMHDIRYWSDEERGWKCDASERSAEGHILGCVGEGCEAATALQPHVDADSNGHCDVCDYHEHSKKPIWNYDDGYHWKGCYNCVEMLDKAAHSLSGGKCTVCGYDSTSTIRITKQPQNVNAVVSNANEDYLSNTMTFSVEATGGSGTLTYQWYRIFNGTRGPYKLEGATAATYTDIVGTDACYGDQFEYYCVITDADGHSVTSNTAKLIVAHDFRYWTNDRHTHTCEASECSAEGHILGCVGESCEAATALQPHVDADTNGLCDVCDYRVSSTSHTHSLNPVEKVEPTHFSTGKRAYYKCDCGACFEDRTGRISIADIDNWGIIPVTDHEISDWQSDANGHWMECTIEGCTHKVNQDTHDYADSADTTCATCRYVRSLAPVTYTVTFNNNGHGTAPATQTVASGNKATEPTALVEEGWIFDGWYEDATFAVAYDFDTPVTSNIILYAKWTGNSVVPPMVAIVEGDGSEWTKGTTTGLKFKSTADFGEFTRVRVDGAEVDAANYTAESGSTIVTLKASFLETLSVGEHKIVIESGNHAPEASFTVKEADTTGGNTGDNDDNTNPGGNTGGNDNTGDKQNPDAGATSPQTGDSSNMFLWIALIFVSLGGLTTTIVYKKRKAVKE